ncbi:MAG: TonB family protein [Candidatus Melainabacteria bacterium]|nr:TonB family protein [Candidatus Melainabacteria bacterium]
MKILDTPRPDSADTLSAPDGQLQTDAASYPEQAFKPLGKNPNRAMSLSLLPGLGHFYLGQTSSGLIFLLASAVSLFLVASACFGGPMQALIQQLATHFHVPFNTQLGAALGLSVTHPAVLTFGFLYAWFVFYVAQDAYLFATRANNPLYPPAKGVRFAPVFGGSYLMHCCVLLLLLATAFSVAANKPDEQITVIDIILEEPPPPPKERPMPEPSKPKAQPKVTPKPVEPKPVQKIVEKPVAKPAEAPPVVKDSPIVAAAPTAPAAPPADTASGQGSGEPSASTGGAPSEGGGGGGEADEADFGLYLSEMEKKIRKAWFPPRGNESAKIIVAFKLNSSGRVSSVRLKTSSGLMLADTAATDAIKNAGPFGNLPKGAPDKVDIAFTFDYTVFNGGGRATLR